MYIYLANARSPGRQVKMAKPRNFGGACIKTPVLKRRPPQVLLQHYCFTITGVPIGAFSKNGSAIPLGKRMQPCDAANGGT
jgi:hypothetical protein